MVKILDENKKPIAYIKTLKDALLKTTIKSEYTLSFSTTVEELKSDYLYNTKNTIEVDGELFRVVDLKDISRKDGKVTIEVFAEHISYDLLNSGIKKFQHEENIRSLMNLVLSGTGFSFVNTDIDETKKVKIDEKDVTVRYIINTIATAFNAEIKWYGNNIDIVTRLGEEKKINFTIEKNLNQIGREIDYIECDEQNNPKVQYSIDVDAPKIDELHECNLGDTITVLDEKLNISVKRRIIEIEKDIITNKNIKIILGDTKQELVDTISKLSTGKVITEVVHQQVINVETAHALNAWIKNLFVEYVETNMDARLDRTTIERDFIRIEDEREEMVHQTLDLKTTEDLLIPNPNGNGGTIQVYFTAIGEHPDAYKYFTITNPQTIYKDLTKEEVEAFKVKVKKVTSESIKYSKAFKEVQLSNGSKTVTPVETWGTGTDATGETDKGKVFVFKDIDAYVIRYMKEDGTCTELRIGESGISTTGDAYIEFANIPLQPQSTIYFDNKYIHMPTVVCNFVCNGWIPSGTYSPMVTMITENNLFVGCTVSYSNISAPVSGAYTAIQVTGKGVINA